MHNFTLIKKFPSLRQLGIAVERYPSFKTGKMREVHGHDVLEMNLLIKGNARQTIGDDKFALTPGSLSVTHYGQQHELTTDGEAIDVFNIYLDPQNHSLPSLPQNIEDAVGALIPLHPNMGHRHNRVHFLQLSQLEQVVKLLCIMEQEQKGKSIAWEQVLHSCLQTFLINLGRAALKNKVALPKVLSGWEIFERARIELENNFTRTVSLEELAHRAGCSKNYFCTRFREYTGIPPMQYILNRRLHHAMVKLRSCNDKVLAIAYDCGFSDLGYFNKKFKEGTGLSPRKYRNQFSMPKI